jgi:hypothetical protein
MRRSFALVFFLFIVLIASVGPVRAQGLVAAAAAADEVERGRALFDKHCRSCHKADRLVRRLYSADTPPRMDVCAFLQGHRRSEGAQDCAIVSYLEDLARQAAQ